MIVQYLKKQLVGFGGIIIYRLLLDINYMLIISPNYDYAYFINEFSLGRCVISYLLLFISIPFILKFYEDRHVFFSNVFVLLYLISFVPNLSFMVFKQAEGEFYLLYFIYWLILFIAAYKIKFFKIDCIKIRQQNVLLYLYLSILMFAVIYISGRYTGFRIHFNITDVYTLRMEAREFEYPGIFGYLLPIAGTVLPILFVYFLNQKKNLLSFIIVIVILLNFSIAGLKGILFSLLIAVFFYFFYTQKIIKLYVWMLSGVSLLAFTEYYLNDTFLLSSLFIRRLLYVPAVLNQQYYEFFSTHDIDFFRQSFLRHFGFVSPYTDPISRVIGANYYSELTAANNGLFSDAIMNMGTGGVLVFPVLLIVILKFTDSLSQGIENRFLIMPALMLTVAVFASPLMSALLTNGILFVMLLFYTFPRTSH